MASGVEDRVAVENRRLLGAAIHQNVSPCPEGCGLAGRNRVADVHGKRNRGQNHLTYLFEIRRLASLFGTARPPLSTYELLGLLVSDDRGRIVSLANSTSSSSFCDDF